MFRRKLDAGQKAWAQVYLTPPTPDAIPIRLLAPLFVDLRFLAS
jgi:hypothetical protein